MPGEGRSALFKGGEGLGFDPVEAARAVAAADPQLARVIERLGPFRLRTNALHSPFSALLEAIVYQQLTGQAAATILGRVRALARPRRVPRPEDIRRLRADRLRAAGLSRAKVLAVKDLAAKTLDGTVPTLARLRRMDDEEILERLTSIRGVGRWTVEMLLIFRLGRPDVLPATDYGIRKGFRKAFGLADLPTPAQVAERGEAWRPYRTLPSWYLWRAVDGDEA
jgi:3-methyladenine DNA glycosylase/8-oxoguanine DNA glycosylase